MAELKQYDLDEIPHLKVHGRTTSQLRPLTLFWTASGVELNIKGSELWMTFESDYQSYEPWISVEINGAYVSRMMVPKGTQTFCIFRGMSPDKIKNVRIYKDVQAMSGDEWHLLQVVSVATDGTFEPLPKRSLQLEFIGDSITSGEGTIGAEAEEDWISMFFGSVRHYARETARALDADYRVISQSGWGTYSGWDNNIHCALPKYYEKVCGLAFGERNARLGAQEDYDFTKWQPDAVIINLGTNDTGAFHSPAWMDPDTGIVYNQRILEDGSFCPEDAKHTVDAIVDTLKKLRRCNPQAKLVWVYGMLGNELNPWLDEALSRYREESGDGQVYFVPLPDTTSETVGARWHPGRKSHDAAAKVLIEALREIL